MRRNNLNNPNNTSNPSNPQEAVVPVAVPSATLTGCITTTSSAAWISSLATVALRGRWGGAPPRYLAFSPCLSLSLLLSLSSSLSLFSTPFFAKPCFPNSAASPAHSASLTKINDATHLSCNNYYCAYNYFLLSFKYLIEVEFTLISCKFLSDFIFC
jgi:hypothetical protein